MLGLLATSCPFLLSPLPHMFRSCTTKKTKQNKTETSLGLKIKRILKIFTDLLLRLYLTWNINKFNVLNKNSYKIAFYKKFP